MKNSLQGKTIFISGAARRIGRELAIACAEAGASIIIHHAHSHREAANTAKIVEDIGQTARIIQADFSNPAEAIRIISNETAYIQNLFGLINNASIFEPINFHQATYDQWQTHMDVNVAMPFLLSQQFAKKLAGGTGRIINMLDWRALRPGRDHFPYTISKSALAAMTKAMALALAPKISVNGLALGAIFPPAEANNTDTIIKPVPAGRWADIREVTDAVLFLLTGPAFITGEIIHLDGGRHLV